jgi:hypothetical protein
VQAEIDKKMAYQKLCQDPVVYPFIIGKSNGYLYPRKDLPQVKIKVTFDRFEFSGKPILYVTNPTMAYPFAVIPYEYKSELEPIFKRGEYMFGGSHPYDRFEIDNTVISDY